MAFDKIKNSDYLAAFLAGIVIAVLGIVLAAYAALVVNVFLWILHI